MLFSVKNELNRDIIKRIYNQYTDEEYDNGKDGYLYSPFGNIRIFVELFFHGKIAEEERFYFKIDSSNLLADLFEWNYDCEDWKQISDEGADRQSIASKGISKNKMFDFLDYIFLLNSEVIICDNGEETAVSVFEKSEFLQNLYIKNQEETISISKNDYIETMLAIINKTTATDNQSNPIYLKKNGYFKNFLVHK